MHANSPTPGASDRLSDQQAATLRTLLDLIIPASADGRLPSAAEFDVWAYVCDKAPGSAPAVVAELDELARHTQASTGRPLQDLEFEQALTTVEALRAERPELLAELARQTACCYYQQDRVLEALGMPARAPFPLGFSVLPGDLRLLDPVRARGPIYREVE